MGASFLGNAPAEPRRSGPGRGTAAASRVGWRRDPAAWRLARRGETRGPTPGWRYCPGHGDVTRPARPAVARSRRAGPPLHVADVLHASWLCPRRGVVPLARII